MESSWRGGCMRGEVDGGGGGWVEPRGERDGHEWLSDSQRIRESPVRAVHCEQTQHAAAFRMTDIVYWRFHLT